MRRPAHRSIGQLLAAVVAVVALAGCGTPALPDVVTGGTNVDVDTPALRAQKSKAGIATCAPGGATASALPDLTLPCLGGGPALDLSTLHGPMVIDLWGSYCTICKKELPVLAAFYRDHGTQVPVLGIDYEDVQPAAAIAEAARFGVTYPQVADVAGHVNAASPFPGIRGAPYLFVIDASGDIVATAVGGVTSEKDLVDLVEQHLGITL